MRILFAIIVGLICLSSCSSWGQTQLNGPDNPQIPDNFEKEFESFEFIDRHPQEETGNQSDPPVVLGKNQFGETEYSVLENQPPEIILNPNSSIHQSTTSETGPTALNQWLTQLVLKHMPHEYNKDKNWGNQSKRWSGVKFRRDTDDGKLETKRRYKQVNHGTWRKYSAKLADPSKKFAVELADFGTTKDRRTEFDISFLADLTLDARQSKWVKGVQLYSVSAEGTATVRLSVHCELGIDMDLSRFPPELVLDPSVTKARIDVDKFDLQRVSKAGGEFAQQVTRLARKELDDKIDEHEKKLVKKINEEIEENRGKLRLSIADAVKLKWFDKARDFIPENVRDTISDNRTAASDSDSIGR